MRTLKQVATNMADAFTRFGLWKGGGSGVSNYLTYDLNKIITTIGASKIQEYTAENDCFIFVPILANNGPSNIYIDNIIIANLYTNSGSVVVSFPPIFLEKGKTIRVERIGNESWMWHELTVYGIKEIESNLHEYSTEEKVVGKWIDGKPIYEKTYILNNINLLTGNNVFDAIENVKVINSNGRINNFSIPYADGGEYIMCVQSNNEIGLWSNNGFYNQSVNIILTIQYIKTTD